MPEKQKFIAFSCPHCPLEDKNAIEWLCKTIAREKPDQVICLGDLHEADAASRWPSEYDFDIRDEWDAANELLGRIYNAYKPAKRVLLCGNHDANFHGIDRIPKKLRRALDWRKNEPMLEYWERPIEYRNRRANVYRIGQVSFSHGFDCGQNSDEFEALRYATCYGLHVRGHTHRPTPAIMRARRTAKLPLNYWYANAGCMREMNPEYMARNDVSQWGQSCVIGEADILKSPRESRQWAARVEIFRMAEDIDRD